MGLSSVSPAFLLHVAVLLHTGAALWGPGSVEPVVEQLAADLNDLKTRVSQLEEANRKKVAFSAFIVKDHDIPASANQIVPFNSVLVNTGEAYNNFTSVFTAPYDGDYFFIVSADVSPDYAKVNLVRNNVPVIKADKDDQVSTHVTGCGIINLTAGDVVAVTHGANKGYVDDGRDSTFTGFLIAESTPEPTHPGAQQPAPHPTTSH